MTLDAGVARALLAVAWHGEPVVDLGYQFRLAGDAIAELLIAP